MLLMNSNFPFSLNRSLFNTRIILSTHILTLLHLQKYIFMHTRKSHNMVHQNKQCHTSGLCGARDERSYVSKHQRDLKYVETIYLNCDV